MQCRLKLMKNEKTFPKRRSLFPQTWLIRSVVINMDYMGLTGFKSRLTWKKSKK